MFNFMQKYIDIYKKNSKLQISNVKSESRAKKSLAGFGVLVLVVMLIAPITVSAVTTPNWSQTWITPSQCFVDPAGGDPTEDSGIPTDHRDIIGDNTNPAVAYAEDTDYFYFKERLNGDPKKNATQWKEHSWVVLMQTSIPAYQYLLALNGKDNLVEIWQNTPATTAVDFSPIFNDPADSVAWSGPVSTYAQATGPVGGAYFASWAIPKSELTGSGITINTAKYFATSANSNNYNKDHLNCYQAISDLGITKSVGDSTPDEEQTIVYTVNVTNNGPDGATNVVVSDLLPNGVTYVSSNPSQGSYNSVTGVWSVGSIANNGFADIEITVTVDDGTGGDTITNTASVDGTEFDNNSANDTDSEDITVNAAPPAPGKIIVIKDTVPNDATAFDFTSTTLTPSSFSLADGDSQSFDNLTVGAYDVAETADPNYSTTSSCDDGSEVSAIGVSAGETVTCTFTNTLKQGGITIVKQTVPDGAEGSFDFDSDFAGSFSLADGGSVNEDIAQGDYSVSEDVPEGWDLSIECEGSAGFEISGNTVSIGLGDGQDLICVFTNTKLGKIIVEKQTNPAESEQSFEFDSNYGSNFFLSDGGQNGSGYLAPGDYSVDEINIPEGWDLTSATCDDDSSPTSISLGAGEIVTCTFVNTQLGKIIVEKVTFGGDGEFGFTASYDEGGFSLSNGEQNESGYLEAGSYSVEESSLPDFWTLTNSVCGNENDPDEITLGAGETVTCTFTNTYDAPESSDLEVTKSVDNSAPQSGDEVTFTITIKNNGPDDATGVEAADLLPSGTSYVSDSPSQGTYNEITGVWSVGSLANAASATLTITATVSGSENDSILNNVEVSANEPDPNTENNEDDASLTIAGEPESCTENCETTPPPPPPPPPSGGGSTGGGSVIYNFGATPPPAPAPSPTPPQVAGVQEVAPPPPQAPQAAGETLPRTGMDVGSLGMLFALLSYGILLPRKAGKVRKTR